MKIEQFVKEILLQIHAACQGDGVYMPRSVEFEIQVNAKGEVCGPSDIAVGTIKVNM